jgi:hypothetical protein
MSHTYSQNVVHVVFSTKDRRKSIPRSFNHACGPTPQASAQNSAFRFMRWAWRRITFIRSSNSRRAWH